MEWVERHGTLWQIRPIAPRSIVGFRMLAGLTCRIAVDEGEAMTDLIILAAGIALYWCAKELEVRRIKAGQRALETEKATYQAVIEEMQ